MTMTKRRVLIAAWSAALAVAVIVPWVATSARADEDAAEPPPFITLGQLARELSDTPGAFEAVLEQLGGGVTAVGALTDEQKAALLAAARSGDFDTLDREPRAGLDTLNLAIRGLAERRGPPAPTPPPPAIVRTRSEALGIPSGGETLTGEPFLAPMDFGLAHGDRLDPAQAATFSDAKRLADVLDRLSLNRPDAPSFAVELGGAKHTTPEGLIGALAASGHTVVVEDQRALANFGDIESGGRAVATPLWVNSGRTLEDGTQASVPVPHAHLAIKVTGPVVNAEVNLFNGLDVAGNGGGGMSFRASATQNQPWVGGAVPNVYEGYKAIEATRLMGLIRRGVSDKIKDFRLALDGYYELGVCTLVPAVIEMALNDEVSIWPLTHDPRFFQSDSELDQIVRRLPVDGRGGEEPSLERLRGSIPWENVDDIPLPELRATAAQIEAELAAQRAAEVEAGAGDAAGDAAGAGGEQATDAGEPRAPVDGFGGILDKEVEKGCKKGDAGHDDD